MSTATDSAGRPALSRSELLAQAVERWSADLSVLGGRDPLLSYRDLKVGTLDLAAAEPGARKLLLEGQEVLVSKLFPYEPLRTSALRSVRAIRDKVRELDRERGLRACYLAVGIATWANPFAARRPTAPVMLRSATVTARDPAETDFVLTVADDPFVNPVLLHALDTQLGLRFDAADLRDQSGRLRYATVVERLREFAPPHVIDGFSIAHRAVFGTFVTARLALAEDLEAFGVDLLEHDVVAALAGDPAGTAAVGRGITPAEPMFRVLDTDAEQDAAVAAMAGQGHLRVAAAPGAGRTQTLAAAVAELTARGQRVLVVSEQRARVEALVERLRTAGLGDIVLDLHGVGTEAAVRQVTQTVRELTDHPPAEDVPSEGSAAGLADELDAYRDAVHRPREPWGISAYEAMVAVAGAPVPTRTTARVRVDMMRDSRDHSTVRAAVREYCELEGFVLHESRSAWFGADVPSSVTAEDLIGIVRRIREEGVPTLRDAATRAAVEVGLAGPSTVAECLSVVDLLRAVTVTQDAFGPGIWDEPLDDLVAATGDRSTRAEHGNPLGFLVRRRLRRRVGELTGQVGRISRATRLRRNDELRSAREQLMAWRASARDGKAPRTGPHFPAAAIAATDLKADLEALMSAHPQTSDLPELSFGELGARLEELINDEPHLRTLPRLRILAEQLAAAGAEDVLAELRARELGAEQADEAQATFDYAWFSSVLESFRAEDPVLTQFERAAHERRVEEFQRVDEADTQLAAARVLAARHRRFAQIAAEHEGQAAVLSSVTEASADDTVKGLLAEAPDVVLAAVPCWVMSPLTVAEALPARALFDVVVIEDAGRLAVPEAVPAIARAQRVVLAGDESVTAASFTIAVEPAPDPDEHEGPWAKEPPPSVVDVLGDALPTVTLTGQYRARDERLVGFAAHAGYSGQLTMVPAAGGRERLTLEVVDSPPAADDPVDSSSAEIERVVDLVLQHVRVRPHESLGVVTLGPRHAQRLDAALRQALIRAPEAARYLREDRAEPFFVRDVERLGGEVRDAVIVSLGYGRSADGRVLYRFGALGRPGGERRLAATTTCARDRLTVVATFRASDLSPRRLVTPGAVALRDFLSYVELDARRAGRTDVEAHDGADPFARLVAARLREAEPAARVVVDYGGPAGIAVAVGHPTRTDRFVLAVETDGPAYAARTGTRERERLRPAQLTRLGWNVHRAWAAAWAADPDGEAQRLVDAYRQAVADADALDWAVAAAEADAVAGGLRDGVGRDSGAEAQAADVADASESEEDAGDDQESEPPSRQGERPSAPVGRSIGDYTLRQLTTISRWVESDGVARSDDEAAALVADELKLDVDDARTADVLRHAVRVGRAGAPALSGQRSQDQLVAQAGGGQ